MDEELLVKLSGDASKYVSMLNDAANKTVASGQTISSSTENTTQRVVTGLERIGTYTNKYAEQVERTKESIKRLSDEQEKTTKKTESLNNQIGEFGKNLKGIGQGVLSFGEALKNVTGGFSLEGSLKEFQRLEINQRLLNTALEANGRNVQSLTKDYNDFAKQMESISAHSKTDILQLIRQAESLDVTGESAKRAVKNALALAESQGRVASEVIRTTAALERGAAGNITDYLPSLSQITNVSEKVAKAQELLAREYKQVEAAANTSSGSLHKLNNLWTSFKQTIGETVATIIGPFVGALTQVVTLFQELPTWIKGGITVTLTLTAILATLTVSIGGVITVLGALTGSIGAYVTATNLAIVASTALKGILIAGVAYAYYQATLAATGAKEAYDQYSKSIQQSIKLNEQWINRFNKSTGEILRDINAIQDATMKKKEIQVEIGKAEKELRGYESAVKSAQNEVDTLNTRWNRVTGNKVLELTNKNLEESQGRLSAARSRVEQLKSAFEELSHKKLEQGLIQDIDKLKESLDQQRRTIGLTSEQIEVYKLKLRGMSDETRQSVQQAIELNEQIKKLNKIGTDSKTTIEQLKTEIEDFGNGLTPTQNKLRHTFEEQIKLVDKLSNKVKNGKLPFEDRQKINDEIDRANISLKEMIDLQTRLDKKVETKRLFDIGQDAKKQFGTFFDLKRKDDLDKAFKTGEMSANVYANALEDIRKKYDESKYAADQFKNSVQSINAVKFGSAETLDRLQAQKELLQDQYATMRRIRDQRKEFGLPEPEKKPHAPTFGDYQKLDAKRAQEFQNRTSNIQDYQKMIAPSSPVGSMNSPTLETNKILQSIDETLKIIRGKPGLTLGSVDINK